MHFTTVNLIYFERDNKKKMELELQELNDALMHNLHSHYVNNEEKFR